MATAITEQKIRDSRRRRPVPRHAGPAESPLYSEHGRSGAWLAEAFAADSAAEIVLEEAAGQAAGMERLRDEVFDAILVNHEPDELDALDLIEGYRAGGAEEPIVVLGTPSEAEMAVLCYEAGADGYVCVPANSTRNLIWVVALAVQKRHLLYENRQLPPRRASPLAARTGRGPAAAGRTAGRNQKGRSAAKGTVPFLLMQKSGKSPPRSVLTAPCRCRSN